MNKKDSDKRIFSLTNLESTPPRTTEDIRRAIVQRRFAEMTPHLAGDDDIGSSAHKTEPEEVVHQSNIAVDVGPSHKRSNDESS